MGVRIILRVIQFFFFISKLPTRENSVSLPVVSSGVATLNSSEELSYKYLQLLLHLHFRNIFAFFSSIFLKYFVFLFWNNFAWKDFAWKERKGSCSVHLLTNRESLDLNSQGEIFMWLCTLYIHSINIPKAVAVGGSA